MGPPNTRSVTAAHQKQDTLTQQATSTHAHDHEQGDTLIDLDLEEYTTNENLEDAISHIDYGSISQDEEEEEVDEGEEIEDLRDNEPPSSDRPETSESRTNANTYQETVKRQEEQDKRIRIYQETLKRQEEQDKRIRIWFKFVMNLKDNIDPLKMILEQSGSVGNLDEEARRYLCEANKLANEGIHLEMEIEPRMNTNLTEGVQEIKSMKQIIIKTLNASTQSSKNTQYYINQEPPQKPQESNKKPWEQENITIEPYDPEGAVNYSQWRKAFLMVSVEEEYHPRTWRDWIINKAMKHLPRHVHPHLNRGDITKHNYLKITDGLYYRVDDAKNKLDELLRMVPQADDEHGKSTKIPKFVQAMDSLTLHIEEIDDAYKNYYQQTSGIRFSTFLISEWHIKQLEEKMPAETFNKMIDGKTEDYKTMIPLNKLTRIKEVMEQAADMVTMRRSKATAGQSFTTRKTNIKSAEVQVNATKVKDVRKLPCKACGDIAHSIFSMECKENRGQNPNLIEKLISSGWCLRCLRRVGASHIEENCGIAENKERTRTFNTDCQGSPQCMYEGQILHRCVCGCIAPRRERFNNQGGAHVDDKVNFSIKINACHTFVEKEKILPNLSSIPVGMVEEIVIYDAENKEIKVVVQYDSGAQMSIAPLNNISKRLKTLEDSKSVEITAVDGRTFLRDKVKTKMLNIKITGNQRENEEKIHKSMMIEVPNLVLSSSIRTGRIPREYQKQFAQQSHRDEYVRPDIILGQNCSSYFPETIIKPQNNVPGLLKSAITGKFLLYGHQDPGIENDETVSKTIINRIIIEKPIAEDFTLWRNYAMQEETPAEHYIKAFEADPALMTYVSENSHKFDEKNGRWIVVFTYHSGLLIKLLTNEIPTLKRMYSMLRKTIADQNLALKVAEQVEKNIREGIWTPVVEGEFEGKQTHYLPINFVISGVGEKQKVRLVCDPSMRGENGLSLNHVQLDLAAIAQKYIPDIKAILIQARTAKYLALGDIASFFNNFMLSPEDQALRLLLLPKDWSQADGGGFVKYAIRRLPFGDQQSAFLAIAGRCKAAMTHGNIIDDEELRAKVVWILLNSVYVDDIFAGSATLDDLYKITNAINQILSFAGMRVKNWAYSGQKQITDEKQLEMESQKYADEYRVEQDSQINIGLDTPFPPSLLDKQKEYADETVNINQEKFLGYAYDAEKDMIVINYAPALEKKVRGKQSKYTLNRENIKEMFPEEISKVQVIRVIQTLFDPLGICLPLTMKLRFLFSRVCAQIAEEKGNWQSIISTQSREEMKKILTEILSIMPIKIPRSIRVEGEEEYGRKAALIVFTDGSLSAYGYAVYLRSEPIHHAGEAKFVMARAKIKGSQALTAPRSELLAAHLAARDINKIKEAAEKYQQISRTIFLTDSMVVLCQLRKDNNAIFSQFVTTRLLEIQKNTDIGQWNHVPGNNNLADMVTRDNGNVEMIDTWLNGGILTKPDTEWQTTSIFDVQVPEKIADLKDTVRIAKVSINQGNPQWITKVIEKYTTLEKVMQIIAYVYRFAIKEMRNMAMADIVDQVKVDLIEMAQKDQEIKKLTPKGKLVKVHNGVAYLVRRPLGTDQNNLMHMIPVIPKESALAQLLIRDIHELYGHAADPRRPHMHLGREYYVIGALTKLKKLRSTCPACAKITHPAIKPYQGAIPKEKLIPSPPFYHMQIDVFGPVEGRPYPNGRTKVKLWGLMIICMYTRAVACQVMEDYSADEVIKALHRHIYTYGKPRTIFADNGTNIKATGRIIITDSEGNTKDASLEVRNAFPGTSFVHGPPAAPWSQGSVERTIGIFKALWKKFNVTEAAENRKMSALDYQTLFMKIACRINDRPLFAGDNPEYFVSPNDLLHNKFVELEEGQLDSKWARSLVIQEAYRKWMKIFSRVTTQRRIFQSEAGENQLQKNDIVLIMDLPNPQTGAYRLGRVVEVMTPRKVKVEFYSIGDKKPKRIERHARTLAIVERPRHDQQK